MTVKTQNGNVILKNGKVSCSCCDTECCMYPAQALADGLYTADDLPDAFIEYAPAGSITYTKLDPPISEFGGLWYYEATISGVVERLGIASNPSLWTYQGQGESGPCLITTFGQQAPGREDQFADTYTVSGSISGTVTRESVCVWRGTGLTLTNFGYQWKVNGNNKSGFQSTPVGSYAGGFAVS